MYISSFINSIYVKIKYYKLQNSSILGIEELQFFDDLQPCEKVLEARQIMKNKIINLVHSNSYVSICMNIRVLFIYNV